MLLLFPCPGTIPIASCRLSCQTSCCAPALFGCTAEASSHLSTAPTTAPTPSCGMDPTPSPSGLGRGTRLSPSATSRPAQKRTPHLAVAMLRLTAGQAPRGSGCHQAGLIFRPTGFFTFSFSGAAKRRSRNRFSSRGPVFFTIWTGGTIPVPTAAVPTPSAITASEIGTLTSFSAGRHQSWGGALWRPGYTPGWQSNQLGVLYHPCTVPVYKLLCIQ